MLIRKMSFYLGLLCLMAYCSVPTFASQQNYQIKGLVLDQLGDPISGAEVFLNDSSSSIARTTTDDKGQFAFNNISVNSAIIVVQLTGHTKFERKWMAVDDANSEIRIVLAPALSSEKVTITASRIETRLGDTPESVLIFSSEDLSSTAAITLDDTLRQSPGFSLFRRSGSRVANPTAQGVSLRGVGASGASRALVLYDGIPLNDPFGGWIYWGRVPYESIERVEVLRGGASSLYGSSAMGGVTNIIKQHPPENTAHLSLKTSYGNQNTPYASLSTGGRLKQWGALLSAEAFETDGYILVDDAERGLVDTRAGSKHKTLDLLVDRNFNDNGRAFIQGSIFDEDRDNGTPLQTNHTYIRQLAIGGDHQSQSIGTLATRAYASTQVFNQSFSSVAADRNSETLTRDQRVPAQSLGFSFQWSRMVGSHQTLIAGFEAKEVRGASDEIIFTLGRPASLVGAGGRERTLGFFIQDNIHLTSRLIINLGARIDRWRNFDSLSTTHSLTRPAPATVVNFVDRTEKAFSPRLSVLYKVNNNISLTASGYRAFRAPTLNELYRAFRVGDVLTLANENLRAERLTGGEAGTRFSFLNGKLNFRNVIFWSEITRSIANVTLRVEPRLITRQRQNLGRTRSRGIELEGDFDFNRHWSISGGYQYTAATVLQFPSNILLEGLHIPQVPRHQLTFQGRYSNLAIATIGLQGRFSGIQFDDDQNRFPLDRYFTLDLFASRHINKRLEAFIAVENLFDQRYEVGRTPIRTLGPPALVNIGLRLRLGDR